MKPSLPRPWWRPGFALPGPWSKPCATAETLGVIHREPDDRRREQAMRDAAAALRRIEKQFAAVKDWRPGDGGHG